MVPHPSRPILRIPLLMFDTPRSGYRFDHSLSLMPKSPPPVMFSQLFLKLIAHRLQTSDGAVLHGLRLIADPGDDSGNSARLQRELQGRSRDVRFGTGDDALNGSHAPHRSRQAITGKVTAPDVALRKLSGVGQLPCQGTLVERHPDNYSNAVFQRFVKESLLGFLGKNIVDEL